MCDNKYQKYSIEFKYLENIIVSWVFGHVNQENFGPVSGHTILLMLQ